MVIMIILKVCNKYLLHGSVANVFLCFFYGNSERLEAASRALINENGLNAGMLKTM